MSRGKDPGSNNGALIYFECLIEYRRAALVRIRAIKGVADHGPLERAAEVELKGGFLESMGMAENDSRRALEILGFRFSFPFFLSGLVLLFGAVRRELLGQPGFPESFELLGVQPVIVVQVKVLEILSAGALHF